MDERALRQIEAALNDIIAEQRAQQVLILGLISQVAGSAEDWRERLDVMRTVAERGAASFEATDLNSSEAEPTRQKMLTYVRSQFDEVQRALLEWENAGKENP